MAFIEMSGVTGKVYVPEMKMDMRKKHSCQDCFVCQMCCNERCRVCRSWEQLAGKTLTFRPGPGPINICPTYAE